MRELTLKPVPAIYKHEALQFVPYCLFCYFLEATCCSPSWEIPSLLWNLRDHYHVHNSLAPVNIHIAQLIHFT